MIFTLRTDRLALRPPLESDAEQLFSLMADERLTTFLTWEAHTSIDTTKTVINSLIEAQDRGAGFHWCVLDGDEIIGLVSLIDVRRKIRTWTVNRCELSYWITPERQGKGFATEASRAAVDFGFNELNFHRIIIAHAGENIESRRICEKLGFDQYAHEHEAFNKNGKWHDLLWYERINIE